MESQGSITPLVDSNPSAAAAGSPSANVSICPDCLTPQTPGSRFCEVCRYDFVNKTVGSPGAVTTTPAPALAAIALASATSQTAAVPQFFERLDAIISVDISLALDDEARKLCPVGTAEKHFHLDLEDNLVGRFSPSKDSHPEVPVNDHGISRRHLKFLRQSDGSFSVLELGSANGTSLNGVPLETGLLTPVKSSDVLTLGMWTRITLKAR